MKIVWDKRQGKCVCVCVSVQCVFRCCVCLDKGSAALLVWVKMDPSVQPLRLTVPTCSSFCDTKFVLNDVFGLLTPPPPLALWSPPTENLRQEETLELNIKYNPPWQKCFPLSERII